MFSKDITGSDAFRDMPSSSQSLYFHLGMEADDDGFIGAYKTVQRSVGCSDDDLKILLSKRFLLPFKSGVIVVKHWLINNTVRKDRYNEIKYLEEKRSLYLKENGAYTDNEENGIPLRNQIGIPKLPTNSVHIGEDRIGENRIGICVSNETQKVREITEEDTKPRAPNKYPHSKEVFSWFLAPEKSWAINTTELKHAELLWERGEERVKKALKYHQAHKDDENYGYKVVKPSDLERKWNDIADYAKR